MPRVGDAVREREPLAAFGSNPFAQLGNDAEPRTILVDVSDSQFGADLKTFRYDSTINESIGRSNSNNDLKDSFGAYALCLDRAAEALRFGNSALEVFQREASRESGKGASGALSYVSLASAIISDLTKQCLSMSQNIDSLSRSVKVAFATQNAEAAKQPSLDTLFWAGEQPARVASEVYWRHLRDEVQSRTGLPLRDLAVLIDVAYPTLVNLGKIRPQSRTSRSVERFHALVDALIRKLGETETRSWLGSEGLAIARSSNPDQFRRSAMNRAYGSIKVVADFPNISSEPDLEGAQITENGPFKAEAF